MGLFSSWLAGRSRALHHLTRFIGVSRELPARGLAGSRASWLFTQSQELRGQHQLHPAGGQPAVGHRCAGGPQRIKIWGCLALPDVTDGEAET